jgi:hypothetical protein
MKDTKISGNVYPSKEQLNVARSGIYLQLKATTKLAEIYGSLTAGIDALGMGEFIENQVQVLASSRAWVHRTEMRLLDKRLSLIHCGVTGCTNVATHTWSGHPTCDACGTPSRKKRG